MSSNSLRHNLTAKTQLVLEKSFDFVCWTVRQKMASVHVIALCIAVSVSLAQVSLPQTPPNAKELILNLLHALTTGDTGALAVLSDRKYINHNLDVTDGKAGEAAGYKYANPNVRVNTLRAFQDGPYVFVHTQYELFEQRVRFDVWRFEDGKAVEHWENWQSMPATPNGAGHTMIDGPTQAKDLENTEANKALVKGFVNDVLGDGKTDLAATYVNFGQYIQHDPAATADGYNATSALIASLPTGTKVCSRIRYLMGEGNFVLVMCDGTVGANATAYYDLYRVENGKIAEHWDVIRQIPPCSQWRNLNGKF